MNNSENKNKMSTTNKVLILAIILALIIVTVTIFTIGYSKYIYTDQGFATADIATMICEMQVESSEKTDTIINPYCTITVSDYDNNKTTETDIGFTIEVKPKENFVLPEFEWKDSKGQIIARSVDVVDAQGNITARTAEFPKQTFKNGQAEDKVYTIVFKNTGEEEVTRKVEFELHAIQEQE